MLKRLQSFRLEPQKHLGFTRATLWRLLLILALAFDLVFLPNCFPPVPDTNPKILEPGKNETGITYEGSWFFLLPQSLSWELRRGLVDGLEINGRIEGFHALFPQDYQDGENSYTRNQESLFGGASLGLKKSLVGSRVSFASHLGLYAGDLGNPMALSRNYLLMGSPHFHFVLGMHAFHVHQWFWTPTFGFGSVLGKRNHFKLALHFEGMPGEGGEGATAVGYMPSIGLGYSHEY
jgi:hypothetical protein